MERIPVRPTATEAQEALVSINEARSRLANYVRSPWWLYPIQGIGVAAFIIGIGFSKVDTVLGTTALAVAIVLFCALPLLQQTPSRAVFDVYTHKGSRGLAAIYACLLLILTVTAVWFLSTAGPSFAWVVYVAAAAGLILTVAMGPLMDNRLERAIRVGQ